MTSEVEWRRQWKPDLSAQPWKPISIEETPYFIKFKNNPDSYELLLSNTEALWYEELEKDDIKSRTKKLNPSVEAPLGKILDHIGDSLEQAALHSSASKLKISFKNLIDSDDQKVLLTLTTKLAGLPFVWKFSGIPAESKMVSEHLTVPLLGMVGELARRQGELFKLLKAKDKEIDDLKNQGVKVTRKHLETTPFDETTFKHTMSVSKDFTCQIQQKCTAAFNPDGQELYRDIMTKHAYINRADWRGDEDDDGTFDPDVGGAVAGASVPSWANRLPPSLASGSVSPKKSPARSPVKSPVKSPTKAGESSPEKNLEMQRRAELEKKLEEEEERKLQKKKKKKMKF